MKPVRVRIVAVEREEWRKVVLDTGYSAKGLVRYGESEQNMLYAVKCLIQVDINTRTRTSTK